MTGVEGRASTVEVESEGLRAETIGDHNGFEFLSMIQGRSLSFFFTLLHSAFPW